MFPWLSVWILITSCIAPVPVPVLAMKSLGTSRLVVSPDTNVEKIRGVGADDAFPRRRNIMMKGTTLQRQYRKVDGGVLWSRNERNLDCTVTYQTHSILQRFMLHFEMLQLDCNDHLYVYDGAHPTGPPKADLSCRNTKQQVGALFTRSNFVTLKYVTDNWGTDANGFKLVITAVKDPKHGCKEFRCKQREFCVSADLTCDGVDHCADGSDEDTAVLCPDVQSEANSQNVTIN
ncbi:unnamed protein product [Parnassius apollo]|uniref:(apollo) hypothetical protein n=1 Tax=Parnassius apollo TaxID=110799 RepID=A0A8S3XZN1_PARAO|nr:unnamed protein product [Parnassius apollo]